MVKSVASKLAENPVNRKAVVAISVECGLKQLYKASPAAEFQSFDKTTPCYLYAKAEYFAKTKNPLETLACKGYNPFWKKKISDSAGEMLEAQSGL